MTRSSRSKREPTLGFTLIEASIIVVVVGIMAAIGTVMFIRHRRMVRMTEATNMVALIKTEQEAYKNESGIYATVSSDVDAFYPAASPGKFATQWGGPCSNCASGNADAWNQLPIHPQAPVMYGYSTVAGVGSLIRFRSYLPPTANECAAIAPTAPFYIIKAQGDVDGDGVSSSVLSLSCSNAVVLTNAGE